jgi:uncharacterized protein DUF6941
MEIEFLVIADAVENVNGKLYMMGGGWNQYRSPAYPGVLRIGIAVSILLSRQESGHSAGYPITFTLASKDVPAQPNAPGMTLNVQAQFVVPPRPNDMPPDADQRVFVAVNGNFPLPKNGKYRVAATLEGQAPKEVEFDAILASPPLIN